MVGTSRNCCSAKKSVIVFLLMEGGLSPSSSFNDNCRKLQSSSIQTTVYSIVKWTLSFRHPYGCG